MLEHESLSLLAPANQSYVNFIILHINERRKKKLMILITIPDTISIHFSTLASFHVPKPVLDEKLNGRNCHDNFFFHKLAHTLTFSILVISIFFSSQT